MSPPQDARLILSDREYQAVMLQNKGLKQKRIAAVMNIKTKTVENLIRSARKKMEKP